MSEVDIFDRSQRYEDLVDTYTVDSKTGKRVPDPPVKLSPRSPEEQSRDMSPGHGPANTAN
jgi:hypothetical protein